MIERVDDRLEQWAKQVVKGLDVSFGPPGDGVKGTGVSLHLMEVRKARPAPGGARPPHQIILRYLVTVWAEETRAAHALLSELAFAAMDLPDLEVELEPLPLALWTALGVSPRPAFVLRVPVNRERRVRAAPLVREPPSVDLAPAGVLEGVVVGPGEKPMAGVQVELPAQARSTRTDRRGRFRLSTMPASSGSQALKATSKGREVSLAATAAEQPLIIRFPPMEE